MEALRKTTGGGDTQCAPGEGPSDLATVAFIVMLLGFAGRALSYGDDLRHNRDSWHAVVTLVLAFVAQALAAGFYYRRYRRCDAVYGFVVFVMVTASVAFVVAAVVRPAPPPSRRCRHAPAAR